MKFSIVIPTYNEENDIARTLDALVNMSYKNKEILVVDDSNDNTPKIVSEYVNCGVVIIRPETRRGRCEARNIGIKAATGDVVIILNADVLLPVDFLDRILIHYNSGYDSVTVLGEVANLDALYARYVGLHHFRKLKRGVYEKRKTTLNGIFWSEAFSVRKTLLDQSKLFPSGYPVPLEAGEDVRFVDELRGLGCKGVIDETIVIKHVAPSTLYEFWKVRKGRGAGTPQVRIYLDNWRFDRLFLILILKAVIRLIKLLTLIPGILYVWELSYFSRARFRFWEAFLLYWCWMIEQAAFTVGEFSSFFKVFKEGR